MSDLLVLSNRGPLDLTGDVAGLMAPRREPGGLVVTVGAGAEHSGAVWLCAAVAPEGGDTAAGAGAATGAGGFHLRPVALDAAVYRSYYDVVANGTLWFCLHGLWDLPRRPRFDRHWHAAWGAYREVNRRFAEEAATAAAPGGTVLVQDYHLTLVPALLAGWRPDLRVVAFLHTPWCSPGELAALPDDVAAEVLGGLAGAGACGFHSARWATAFAACQLEVTGREVRTFVAPAAIDADNLRAVTASAACQAELRRLDAAAGDRRLIVRVDRIELSKNVLRGFWAFDEMLETRPDLRGTVTFVAMLYPSRQGLAEYQAYHQEVQGLARLLNDKWRRPGWEPILLDVHDDHPRSVAAMQRADVVLVNPVRDGLNLVAKEAPLVNERDAVVVLSRQAGAWDELGSDALGVNPFDVSGTASALASALDMPASERRRRADGLRKVVAERTPLDWFDDLRAAAAKL